MLKLIYSKIQKKLFSNAFEWSQFFMFQIEFTWNTKKMDILLDKIYFTKQVIPFYSFDGFWGFSINYTAYLFHSCTWGHVFEGFWGFFIFKVLN